MTRATRVNDINDARDKPAAYQVSATALLSTCPCGCGVVKRIDLQASSWNYDKNSPTLSAPVTFCGHFTGKLVNGVWEKAT